MSCDDHDPQYSNDGTMIAFRSYRDDPDGEQSAIYIMTEDGEEVQRISELGGHAQNHAWSPDDTLIAYQSDVANTGRRVNDIYVYELETEQTRLVTNNEGEAYENVQDFAPTWYCETTIVVFASRVEGDNNIYMVDARPIDAPPINVDEEAERLTESEHNDRNPQNSPPEENASREGWVPPRYGGAIRR